MAERIKISPAFCAMVCVIGWLDGSICLSFIAAVILHEAAHLITAALCGATVESVNFSLCGAVIQAGNMNYRREFLIALSGPAISILSAVAAKSRFAEFAVISLVLAVLNLLPIYPMDGGRALKALLLLRVQPVVVCKILRSVTFAVCGGLMILSCWYAAVCQAGIWPIFAALAILWRVGEAAAEDWK